MLSLFPHTDYARKRLTELSIVPLLWTFARRGCRATAWIFKNYCHTMMRWCFYYCLFFYGARETKPIRAGLYRATPRSNFTFVTNILGESSHLLPQISLWEELPWSYLKARQLQLGKEGACPPATLHLWPFLAWHSPNRTQSQQDSIAISSIAGASSCVYIASWKTVDSNSGFYFVLSLCVCIHTPLLWKCILVIHR